MQLKRGTIKRFREYFNQKFLNDPKHKNYQFHQLSRGYGDYLYFQDRVKFHQELLEAIISGEFKEI